ncbi:hypothetical protein C0992_007438, partial [Termitomyces sp. T32_za158]
MSSNSSLGRALVTRASTEIGSAIALGLAKKFDVAISDIPGASTPLEALKAQIDGEGRKSAIISDDFLATLEADCERSFASDRLIAFPCARDPCGDELFGHFFRTKRLVKDQLSKLHGSGTYVIEVFSKIESEDQSALTLVFVEEEGSAGTTVSLKSEIRELTETAAKEFATFGINVNSYFTRASAVETNEVRIPAKSTNEPLMGKVAIGGVETAKDAAKVVSFLASKSARRIT